MYSPRLKGDVKKEKSKIIFNNSKIITNQPTLSSIIMELEKGNIWKVTILLETHPFLTEPWLWEVGCNASIQFPAISLDLLFGWMLEKVFRNIPHMGVEPKIGENP